LQARVDWLACEVPCIPGRADLSLDLPVREQSQQNPGQKENFERARAQWPVNDLNLKVTGIDEGNNIRLVGQLPQALRPARVEFFPFEQDIIEHSAPQVFRISQDKKSFSLVLQKNGRSAKQLKQLKGVAVAYGAMNHVLKAWDVEAALTLGKSPTGFNSGSGSLWLMLGFAFLGGMILNLMPCVFPILSIKVLTFIRHAHDRRALIKSVSGYTLGVVTTFALLAFFLIVLRGGGNNIGWGFQFQSPYFVSGISVFLFLIALNFFGLWEWRLSFSVSRANPNVFHWSEAFFSGILAVIVATPCTAPFMGTALGFAFTQPTVVSLLIFIFLGLGLAFPFAGLCLFPGLLNKLPKPGPWMEYFKKFLGFPLLATVIWLLWVLAGQKGVYAVIAQLFGCLLIALGLWIHRLGGAGRVKAKFLEWLAWLMIVAGIVLPLNYLRTASSIQGIISEQKSKIQWLNFDQELLSRLPQEGKIVFVDYTARWCLTCQVNKRLVLEHPDVVRKFKEMGIVAIKADWTNHDDEITQSLAEFGKNSVPLYVLIYPSREGVKTQLLPEILTVKIVLQSLGKINR
jgi:thiol:disulfide interchange protein DsbD